MELTRPRLVLKSLCSLDWTHDPHVQSLVLQASCPTSSRPVFAEGEEEMPTVDKGFSLRAEHEGSHLQGKEKSNSLVLAYQPPELPEKTRSAA